MEKFGYVTLLLLFFFGFCFSAEAASLECIKIESDTQHITQKHKADLQTVPEATFRKIFNQYIWATLGKDPSDAIISRFKVTGNRPVPSGNVACQVFQKSKGMPMGYVRLIAIITVDGISRIEVELSGWVDVFGPVVCTNRSMNRGEIIRESDVYLARKNISRMPSNVLTDSAMAVGFVLKNNLRENASLKEYMLKRNPTVSRGDRVTILAEIGSLKISVPGRTLEKGFVGDLIRVQNSMSRKKIFARIIDHTTVAVDF